MAVPKWLDFFSRSAGSTGATPSPSTVQEGILACLASMASGTNPDGTPFGGFQIAGLATAPITVANGTSVLTSLSNVSAAGRGSVLQTAGSISATFATVARSNHTMVVVSGAGVSAGSVQLQGSLDTTNWFNLGTAVSTTTATTVFPPVFISNSACIAIAANIITPITGGTISAYVCQSG